MSLRGFLPRMLKSGGTRPFARGDDAVRCSFCQRNRFESGTDLIVGPVAVICADCARIALDESISHSQQVADGLRVLNIMILWEPACLLPASRRTLAEDLGAWAESLSSIILSFSYRCGYGILPDQLSAQIAIPKSANRHILRETFTALAQFDPPPQDTSGRW